MSMHINNTGKLLGAAVVAWVGSKILNNMREDAETRAAPSGGSALQAALDRNMAQETQDALTSYAIAGDGRSFTALLDSQGCPANPSLRASLWRHFGGD